MARVIDITEKLNFEEDPKLKVKDVELEVNQDAPTMLKVMGLMGGDPGVNETMEAYNLMFSEKSREKISEMKLSFKNLLTLIEEAVTLITGEASPEKEQ